MVNVRAFKPLAIVFSMPENLLLGISGALETMEESHFLSKNMFCRKCHGISHEMVSARDFNALSIVFRTPENLLL